MPPFWPLLRGFATACLPGRRGFSRRAGPDSWQRLFATALAEPGEGGGASLPAGLPAWFVGEARRALGPCLEKKLPPLTQLLNLAGAGLCNRMARESFLATELRVVAVPERLAVPEPGGCRASRNSLGRSCRNCTRGCPLRAVAEVCRSRESLLVLAGHGAELFATGTGAAFAAGGVGVVRVVPVEELLAEAWKARAAGVPAQCLPLDGGARECSAESVNQEALAAVLEPAPEERQVLAVPA